MVGRISLQRFVVTIAMRIVAYPMGATGRSTEWAEHTPYLDSDEAVSNDSASDSDSEEQEEGKDEQTLSESKLGNFGWSKGHIPPRSTEIRVESDSHME